MLALRLYSFFQKNKALLAVLTVLLLATFAYFSSRLKMEEDITRFLPKDKKIDEINFILQNLKLKDKLVIHLHHADSSQTDPSELMSSAELLADTLLQTQGDYIRELNYKVSDNLMMETYQTFYENLPVFLDESDYPKIERLLAPDSLRQLLKSNYNTLLSPSGMVLGAYIRRDPLNLTPIALKKMQNLQFDENFAVNEGYIQTLDQKHLLMFITPSENPYETSKNGKFIASLDEIIQTLITRSGGRVVIEYYGATPVSVGNSLQIRQDSILTLSIALGVILFFLFLFFRRVMILVYILLPVVFGGLFSLSLLYFIKGEISVIALGAGSAILGIAINYSLHFFTHFKHERSVRKVIEDLTLPMLIGCVTTVSAFLSLQFAKSQALHDFGLFAGFSLIGAVLFSITVLPHLLKTRSGNPPETSEGKVPLIDRLLSYPLDKNRTVVLLAFLLTLVFVFTARNVNFESDMAKMNYQSDQLNRAQENLDRINKYSLKSVYVISRGQTLDEAMRVNERASRKLENLKAQGVIDKYASVSAVMISDSLQRSRIERWNRFWTPERKDSLKHRLQRYGLDYKFREDAFSSFYGLLYKDFSPLSPSREDSLKKLVAGEWVTENTDLTTIVNLVKTEQEHKEEVYEAFNQDKNVLVFDKQYMTNRFIEIISSDFNLILALTAFMVFGFMLLSHGRIELAVINFLPMFISWIWILGIMGLLGMKFNIINIIISTFIFGLGDDYSIFIMDGLAHEYKYGKKKLMSYKTSIFLSALTNIVGVGVLVFAKHPALKSVAAITIIGMCTVLFISFIVQPLFYNFLILNRRRKGLLPYTFLNLFITGAGFLIFVGGSLIITATGFVMLRVLPGRKKRRKLIYHYMIMYVCKGMVYLVANVRKNLIDTHLIRFGKPSVIISNHQSHIDLALILMLHPKIIVFTNDTVWNSPLYGQIVRMADFYPASRGYENALPRMRALVEDGYSILIFPEGTRSSTSEILRFHKGAFYLAEHLNLDIQPMILHGAGDLVTKGDFHFKEGEVSLKFLPPVSALDTSFGHNYQERSKKIREYIRKEYEQLRQEKETVDYFRPKLIKNYIYKGPVLEWYCRIKVRLEDNYRLFENLVPRKGKIVDLGCGYGFLPLMLGFMSKDREITGIDYDEEKIEIASHCVSRNTNTRFIQADVSEYELPQADVFIISDLLHYLLPEQQAELIRRCVSRLNRNGLLIIRDADADKAVRHRGTRLTELFSTRSGFNKTKPGGLHFSSAGLIRDTLDAYSFIDYQVVDNTRLTSNVTFIAHYK